VDQLIGSAPKQMKTIQAITYDSNWLCRNWQECFNQHSSGLYTKNVSRQQKKWNISKKAKENLTRKWNEQLQCLLMRAVWYHKGYFEVLK